MMNFKTIIIMAVILLLGTACDDFSTNHKQAEPTPISERKVKWTEDIRVLKNTYKIKQLNFTDLILEEYFNQYLDTLVNNVDSLSDTNIIIIIQRLIAKLNIGHNVVIPPSHVQFDYLPIVFEYFQDGVYVTKTVDQYKFLIGQKITHIETTPISSIIDSMRILIPAENEYGFRKEFPRLLSNVDILKYFIKNINSSTIGLTFFNGEFMTGLNSYTIKSSMKDFGKQLILLDGQQSTPLYLKNRSNNYWMEYLPESKILFVKYNVCQNDPNKPFTIFSNELESFIENNEVGKFVLDVRGNSGGNSDVLTPLIFILNTYLNTQDKLFLITDRKTFSAALLNSIKFKQISKGTIVGEPSGGSPNHYGEIESTYLPHSKFQIITTKEYFIMGSFDPPNIIPMDKIILPSISDYISGLDPVMDYIIGL